MYRKEVLYSVEVFRLASLSPAGEVDINETMPNGRRQEWRYNNNTKSYSRLSEMLGFVDIQTDKVPASIQQAVAAIDPLMFG